MLGCGNHSPLLALLAQWSRATEAVARALDHPDSSVRRYPHSARCDLHTPTRLPPVVRNTSNTHQPTAEAVPMGWLSENDADGRGVSSHTQDTARLGYARPRPLPPWKGSVRVVRLTRVLAHAVVLFRRRSLWL